MRGLKTDHFTTLRHILRLFALRSRFAIFSLIFSLVFSLTSTSWRRRCSHPASKRAVSSLLWSIFLSSNELHLSLSFSLRVSELDYVACFLPFLSEWPSPNLLFAKRHDTKRARAKTTTGGQKPIFLLYASWLVPGKHKKGGKGAGGDVKALIFLSLRCKSELWEVSQLASCFPACFSCGLRSGRQWVCGSFF